MVILNVFQAPRNLLFFYLGKKPVKFIINQKSLFQNISV
uniref:Uncharacterized protein n=1 Tax=uncultured Desulfobacterium sp. TaxID=201089 RepID=E1YHD7_9BACT|nr:unknown protein [uncultured Desulfobacterium sp.]